MEQVKIKHVSITNNVARSPAHAIAVDCAGQGAENKFSVLSVQEVFLQANQRCSRKQANWVHPASCKMGTGSFPGVKCGRGVLLTTHPLLVPRSWNSRAIPLPTLWATPGL